jgi:hypothetical protein
MAVTIGTTGTSWKLVGCISPRAGERAVRAPGVASRQLRDLPANEPGPVGLRRRQLVVAFESFQDGERLGQCVFCGGRVGDRAGQIQAHGELALQLCIVPIGVGEPLPERKALLVGFERDTAMAQRLQQGGDALETVSQIVLAGKIAPVGEIKLVSNGEARLVGFERLRILIQNLVGLADPSVTDREIALPGPIAWIANNKAFADLRAADVMIQRALVLTLGCQHVADDDVGCRQAALMVEIADVAVSELLAVGQLILTALQLLRRADDAECVIAQVDCGCGPD